MMSFVAVFCGVCVLLGLVVYWMKTKKNKTSYVESDAPRDTVVLHQYGPAPYVPSISPFVMKLETYLRVAKIPYVNRFDRKPGPKGKLPWIQYNDDVISDSQIIIQFLNNEFNTNLNKNLTNQQKALGHVVRRMVEEWLYWGLIMFRVVFDGKGTVYRMLGLPSIFIWYMRTVVRPRLAGQGIGRHSQQEVVQMVDHDFVALDTILGNRKYLFGDTPDDVTEFDCALFGQLCQLTWQTPNCGVEERIQENYPRLVSYCERMRHDFWPDWEDRLKKSATSKEINTINSQPSSKTSSSSPPSTHATSITLSPLAADNKETNNNNIHDHLSNGVKSTRRRQPIEE